MSYADHNSAGSMGASVVKNGNAELKLVIIGRGGVGKSCLMMQYVRHRFQDSTEPTDSVGDMNYTQRVVGENAFRLQLIDTAGQEEYSVFQQQYYHSGHGFLAVFDLSNKQSMNELHTILRELGRAKDVDNADVRNVPVVLVANKCDLPESEIAITQQDVDAFCRQYDTFPFFRTSAKTRHNVEEAFEQLIKQTQNTSSDSNSTNNNSGSNRKPSKKSKLSSTAAGGKLKCNIL